jgi:NADPH:quinone reductase-like Zn-dependent oxidoreductase
MGRLGGLDRTFTGPLLSIVGKQRLGGMVAKADRADLETLAGMVAAGEVKPAITARWKLDEAPDALRVLGTGHSAGKAVVLP